MSSYREEQLQEIEALISVFGESSERVKYTVEKDEIHGAISVEFEALSSELELFVTEKGGIFISILYSTILERKNVKVSALPPANLKFKLPQSYPSESSPEFEVECIWFSEEMVSSFPEE